MKDSKSHAEKEFGILEKTQPDAIVLQFRDEILALCDAFGKSGQSGGSAPYYASAISQAVKKLMMYEVIAPLTGEESEWVNTGDDGDGAEIFQNIRYGSVFKKGKDGRAYFTKAIVFDGDIGGRFTGNASVTHNGENIGSRQYIREFPFVPKTFFVDVKDFRWADKEEKTPDENGDWWTHQVKGGKQLDEVFEYYDRYGS